MKVAMLGSGSRGNSTLVATDNTRILVDAGFSGRQLALRMRALGVEPESIDAVVLTHEHSDHVHGAGIFARRYGTPVYLTAATREACRDRFRGEEDLRAYEPAQPFAVGDLRVHPFLTVHDAADPVAVTVEGKECGTRVGVATDLGRPTTAIRHSLAGCDFLILESNHDETLLRTGPYPPSVQARIASSHGHLSNHAAAEFARELVHPRLAGILLAHLSVECNRPELAMEVMGKTLANTGWSGWLQAAAQDEPTPLLEIARLREEMGPAQLTLL
jgi:phosphoribosyl 1,2-cyclic phosphodiesterase